MVDENRHLKWSHMSFCACEALGVLRFRYLGLHFLKPGDIADISVS